MKNKYWVQYRYENVNAGIGENRWYTISDFVTTGEMEEFEDLESWWIKESVGCEHEILQVVKL